jgi:S-DNA-T family DNA segregation ATPase FtsK/SpoIIIE
VTAVEPFDPMFVDPPEPPIDLPALAARVHQRRPILPPWMRDAGEFRALLIWLARYSAHITLFHTARSPIYLARFVARSPAGLWVLVSSWWVWALDYEQRDARIDAARRCSTNEYLHLARLQREHMRNRWIVTGTVAVPITSGVVVFWLVARPVWHVAGYLLVIVALGKLGGSADKPITDRATVSPFTPAPLRAGVVEQALQSLGIAAMTEKKGDIGFPAPIRDIGSGWLASVDLPLGVTPVMVMDRRQQLASGLRRPVGCVWPDADPEAHGGRLELTVLKVEMSKARQRAYPLRKAGAADIFTELPFGTDQRGRPVAIPLIESNLLIGSLPGAGKTASLRCVLLGCALDPTVELHCWELKGSGDLESLERVSHAYGSGVDDHTIESCLDGLRGLLGELERRAEQLKRLRATARDLVPDSKVTRELANRRGLHPIVFVVDEAQELFGHPQFGAEAGDIATALIKRGRALAVVLILATQRPDAGSFPSGVKANVGIRFCLRVMDQPANDMILGTSAYQNGLRATTFTRSDRGIGYLVGATDAPTVTRSYYLDQQASDAIVSRARVLREQAGLLTGHAAGDEVLTRQASLLDDLRTVFAQCQVLRLSTERILEVLGALRPALYAGWTPEQLAAALRPHEIAPTQVWVDGRNKKGYTAEMFHTAIG